MLPVLEGRQHADGEHQVSPLTAETLLGVALSSSAGACLSYSLNSIYDGSLFVKV